MYDVVHYFLFETSLHVGPGGKADIWGARFRLASALHFGLGHSGQVAGAVGKLFHPTLVLVVDGVGPR